VGAASAKAAAQQGEIAGERQLLSKQAAALDTEREDFKAWAAERKQEMAEQHKVGVRLTLSTKDTHAHFVAAASPSLHAARGPKHKHAQKGAGVDRSRCVGGCPSKPQQCACIKEDKTVQPTL
jgi:hypothetical protein